MDRKRLSDFAPTQDLNALGNTNHPLQITHIDNRALNARRLVLIFSAPAEFRQALDQIAQSRAYPPTGMRPLPLGAAARSGSPLAAPPHAGLFPFPLNWYFVQEHSFIL